MCVHVRVDFLFLFFFVFSLSVTHPCCWWTRGVEIRQSVILCLMKNSRSPIPTFISHTYLRARECVWMFVYTEIRQGIKTGNDSHKSGKLSNLRSGFYHLHYISYYWPSPLTHFLVLVSNYIFDFRSFNPLQFDSFSLPLPTSTIGFQKNAEFSFAG